jgi:hypothetical protein
MQQPCQRNDPKCANALGDAEPAKPALPGWTVTGNVRGVVLTDTFDLASPHRAGTLPNQS